MPVEKNIIAEADVFYCNLKKGMLFWASGRAFHCKSRRKTRELSVAIPDASGPE